MTCVRCGKILEPDEKFCPACGKAVELPQEQPAEPVAPAAEEVTPPTPMYGMNCTQNDRPSASVEAVYKAPAQQAPTTAQYKAPAAERPAAKEKEFFGKGAFILCLVVIAILAAAAGMFAYMYFSLIGMI